MYPSKEPLFKFAIFICGGVPLQVLADLGVEIPGSEWDWDDRSKRRLMSQASEASIKAEGENRWTGLDGALEHDVDVEAWVDGLGGKKIPIPTAHVFGNKDPRARYSLLLASFCEDGVRRVVDHGGGHEIPRAREVSEKMAELVEWGVKLAKK